MNPKPPLVRPSIERFIKDNVMRKKPVSTVLFIFMLFAMSVIISAVTGCGSSGGGEDVKPVVTDDSTPDTFTFTEQNDVPVNIVITSNEIMVTEITVPTGISIVGNDAEYSINNSDYTRDAGTVKNNDRVTVRMVSSPEYHDDVTATVTIGGISASFKVATQKEWAVVSAGAFHTLGVKTDGTLWGWGSNLYGQNGNGSKILETRPKQIGVEKDWCFVTAGIVHSMALKTDGSLWGWGSNSQGGQIGNGTTETNVSIPERIGADKAWACVAAGQYHTLAVTTDGKLYAWGNNTFGQLGDGTTENKNIPTQIGESMDWAKVSASYNHSIGITTDGSLYAWGNNYHGQLGIGTTGAAETEPKAVAPGTTWASVSAGLYSTMAINTEGHIYAWGYNKGYRLGDGTENTLTSPTRIGGDLGDLSWASVSTSGNHTLAVTEESAPYVWGSNPLGQLGDGTQENKSNPIPLMTDIKKWSFVSASCGGSFSLAIDGEGFLWAWGGDPIRPVGVRIG